MSGKGAYQQVRVVLTRIFVGVVFGFVAVSSSRWETELPIMSAVLFFFGCFLAGIASLGRLWCSLYIAGHKTKDLVTVGPYSICRNPLYFFSFLGGIGVGLASETATVPAIIMVVFLLYYPYVIRFEEKKLLAGHGQKFEAYCRQVPRFWPKWSLLAEPEEYSLNPRTFKKHLFSALWFVWLLGVMELIEDFRESELLPTYFSIY